MACSNCGIFAFDPSFLDWREVTDHRGDTKYFVGFGDTAPGSFPANVPSEQIVFNNGFVGETALTTSCGCVARYISNTPLAATVPGFMSEDLFDPSNSFPSVTLTLPARPGMSADVTGIPIPLLLDASTLPAGVSQDGGNLRAYDSNGAAVPIFVTGVDPSKDTGTVYLKSNHSATVATEYTIQAVPGATYPARDDPLGSLAVFSESDAVFMASTSLHNMADASTFWNANGNGDPNAFAHEADSVQINCHQGIAKDRTTGHITGIDDRKLVKFAEWVAAPGLMPRIDEHLDAHLTVRAVLPALTNIDHFCDGQIDDNGHLWTVCNNNNFDQASLCQFDTRAAGIPLLNAWDISTTHRDGNNEVSSGCVVLVGNEVWAVSFQASSRFIVYQKDGSFDRYVPFTNTDTGATVTFSSIDGGECMDGQIFLAQSDSAEVTSCSFDGVFPTAETTRADGLFNRRGTYTAGKMEGITRDGDGWLMLLTPAENSGFISRQQVFDVSPDYLAPGPSVYPNDNSQHRFTLDGWNSDKFSFSCNVRPERDGTQNLTIVAAVDSTESFRQWVSADDGRYPGLFSTSDDWLYENDPRVEKADSTFYHIAGKFGATQREIIIDGGTPVSEPCTPPGSPLQYLVLAGARHDNTTSTHNYKGYLGFCSISKDEKTSDWHHIDRDAWSGALSAIMGSGGASPSNTVAPANLRASISIE